MNGLESIDWSKIPTSTFGYDVWFEWVAEREISKLERHLQAIDKWGNVAAEELRLFEEQCEGKKNDVWDEYGYDPIDDERMSLHETERVMFASLAVSIASSTESFIFAMCRIVGVEYTKPSGETDFGVAKSKLGSKFNLDIDKIDGYTANQRARILGNCFKHNGGRKNQKFVGKYGGELDQAIEYENEKWQAMIEGTETLFFRLAEMLNGNVRS